MRPRPHPGNLGEPAVVEKPNDQAGLDLIDPIQPGAETHIRGIFLVTSLVVIALLMVTVLLIWPSLRGAPDRPSGAGGPVPSPIAVAQALASEGRLTEALRTYDEALRHNPGDLEARCGRAEVYFRIG